MSGCTLQEASDQTGLPLSTIRYHVKKAGKLRSPSEAQRLSASKGRKSTMLGKKRVFSEEWRANMSKAKLGKGKGTSLKPSGYIEITMGEHKFRGEHRVIAEQMIGRALGRDEVVHHKDGDRSNNDPSNLQVMTRAEHAAHHAQENLSNRTRDHLGRFE